MYIIIDDGEYPNLLRDLALDFFLKLFELLAEFY
jgi:hypothetical protein